MKSFSFHIFHFIKIINKSTPSIFLFKFLVASDFFWGGRGRGGHFGVKVIKKGSNFFISLRGGIIFGGMFLHSSSPWLKIYPGLNSIRFFRLFISKENCNIDYHSPFNGSLFIGHKKTGLFRLINLSKSHKDH